MSTGGPAVAATANVTNSAHGPFVKWKMFISVRIWPSEERGYAADAVVFGIRDLGDCFFGEVGFK